MAKIYKGVSELIGKTPLLEVTNIEKELELEASQAEKSSASGTPAEKMA